MQAQKLYDDLMQKQLNRGVRRGRRDAEKEYVPLLKKQHEQGLASLRTAIEQTCATRGLKLTGAHRAKLTAEQDSAVLLQWHARALTASRAKEIFA